MIKDWIKNKETSQSEISRFISQLKYNLPKDYISFMLKYNGGEGFVGERYFILWPIEDLIIFNEEYEVDKYLEGFFLIGSNGGGEGIGFDLDNFSLISVPFIGMSRRYVEIISADFGGIFGYE